jgi:hypothetical protein
MNERDRAVMDSCLANAQDATFRGFDASVQKEKFAGPLRSLFECVYRMGFESGWHAHDNAMRPAGIEGMVHMVAYGDNRDVRGMFDTPEQAHAFVAWLKPFIKPAGDVMPQVIDGATPSPGEPK